MSLQSHNIYEATQVNNLKVLTTKLLEDVVQGLLTNLNNRSKTDTFPQAKVPLLICTFFLKNQVGKIKFDELDF